MAAFDVARAVQGTRLAEVGQEARVSRRSRTVGISPGQHADILTVMTKRLVDIDDELLGEATTILGAATMKEAVNRSLEMVVLAARRRRHADRLEAMRGLDLAKPKVMSGAWR